MKLETYSHLSALLQAKRVLRHPVDGFEAKGDAGRELQEVTITEQKAFALLVDHVCIPLRSVARQILPIYKWFDIIWVVFVEQHGVDVNVSA